MTAVIAISGLAVAQSDDDRYRIVALTSKAVYTTPNAISLAKGFPNAYWPNLFDFLMSTLTCDIDAARTRTESIVRARFQIFAGVISGASHAYLFAVWQSGGNA